MVDYKICKIPLSESHTQSVQHNTSQEGNKKYDAAIGKRDVKEGERAGSSCLTVMHRTT